MGAYLSPWIAANISRLLMPLTTGGPHALIAGLLFMVIQTAVQVIVKGPLHMDTLPPFLNCHLP